MKYIIILLQFYTWNIIRFLSCLQYFSFISLIRAFTSMKSLYIFLLFLSSISARIGTRKGHLLGNRSGHRRFQLEHLYNLTKTFFTKNVKKKKNPSYTFGEEKNRKMYSHKIFLILALKAGRLTLYHLP